MSVLTQQNGHRQRGISYISQSVSFVNVFIFLLLSLSSPPLTEDVHPDEHLEADVALVLRQHVLPAGPL